MLILLGSAVADSMVARILPAFAFRFGMFLLVALYAWASMALLNRLGWLGVHRQEATSMIITLSVGFAAMVVCLFVQGFCCSSLPATTLGISTG